MAMKLYHRENGCFPAARVRDPASGKVHSWRVTLLPYLGHRELHKKYRFDEEWGKDVNLALSDYSMEYYLCPSSSGPSLDTNYAMIIRPQHDEVEIDFDRKYVLVAELEGSGIRWTEPRDISIDDMSFKINDRERLSISSNHEGGAHILWSDGTVEFLSDSLDPAMVRSILLNGEAVNQ